MKKSVSSVIAVSSFPLLVAACAPSSASQPPQPPPTPVGAIAVTPISVASPATAPAVAPAGSAGGVDISRIANAMAAATSYRVQATIPSQQGPPVEMAYEVVRPDRLHMRTSQQGQSFEMIIIGSDSYMNAGGTWIKAPAGTPTGSGFASNANQVIDDFNKSVQEGDTYTPGGPDVVNGAPCQQVMVTTTNPQRANGTWCFGTADSLPRRFTSPAVGTMLFTDWNAPLRIDAPV